MDGQGGTITWFLTANDADFQVTTERVRRNARRTARDVDREFKKGMDGARLSLDDFRRDLNRSSQLFRDFQIAARGFQLNALIIGAVAAGGAIIELAGALVAATGAIYSLPGILAPVAGAFGVVATAAYGMGDAFEAVAEGDAEKLAEAMEKLSPSAREVVRAFGEVNEAFKPIRASVQDKVFSGLGDQIREVAAANLPALKVGMEEISVALNGMAKEAARVAKEPFFRGILAKTMATTAKSTEILTQAVDPLARAVAGLVEIGLPYNLMLAGWIIKQAEAANAYVNSANGQRELTAAIDLGIVALQKLGDFLGSVGSLFVTLFKVSNQEGLSFIDTLTEIVDNVNAWIQTEEGQRKMTALFESANYIISELAKTVGTFLDIILGLVEAYNNLEGPAKEIVTQMLIWSAIMGPLLTYVSSQVASMKLLFVAFREVKQAIEAASGALTAFRTGMSLVKNGKNILPTNQWMAYGQAAGQASAATKTAFGSVLDTVRIFAANLLGAKLATTGFMGVAAKLGTALRVAFAVATGPVGLIIGAITLLVGGFIWLWNNVEGFRNFWVGVWDGIKNTVSVAVESIKSYFSPLIDTVSTVFNGIKDTASRIIEDIKSVFQGPLDTISEEWNRLKDNFNKAMEPVKKTIEEVRKKFEEQWNSISEAIKPALDTLGGLFNSIKESVKPVIDAFSDWLKSSEELRMGLNILGGILLTVIIAPLAIVAAAVLIVVGTIAALAFAILFAIAKFLEFANYVISGSLWADLQGLVQGAGEWIKTKFGEAWDAVKGFFAGIGQWFTDRWNDIKNALSTVGEWFNTKFQEARDNVNRKFSSIGQWFTDRWNDIKNAFGNVGRWFSDKFQGAKDGVINKFREVVDWVRGMPGRVTGALGNVGRTLYNSGQSLIMGFWDGISSAFSKVKGWVSGKLGDLRKLFPFSPAKEGPFSGRGYTSYSGMALITDFGLGITKGMSSAITAAENAMSQVSSSMSASSDFNVESSFMPMDSRIAPASLDASDSSSSNSAGVTIYQTNEVYTDLDMDQVNRNMTWELGKR